MLPIMPVLNIYRDYLCAESLDKKKQKFDLSEWKTEIAKVSDDVMQCIQREPVLSLSLSLSLVHSLYLSCCIFLFVCLSLILSLLHSLYHSCCISIHQPSDRKSVV